MRKAMTTPAKIMNSRHRLSRGQQKLTGELTRWINCPQSGQALQ
jgi:hypothetical protein